MLAIIKREYFERVRTKAFIIGTLLGPIMMLVLSLAPALLMNMKTGEATRISIVDETGKLSEGVRAALESPDTDEDGEAKISDAKAVASEVTGRSASGNNTVSGTGGSRVAQAARNMKASFAPEEYQLNGRTLEQAKQELDARIVAGTLDAYIVLPKDVLNDLQVEYRGRNTSDVITISQLRRTIGRAVSEQRLRDANLDGGRVRDLLRPIEMKSDKVTATGSVSDSGGNFFAAYIVGFLIYLTIIIYGGIIMSAIVEEKQTRISEVLFSSAPAFPLMMGKLIGIGLVALTQFAVWAVGMALVGAYGAAQLAMSGASFGLPVISPLVVVSFFLFFIVGFFLYATLYLLVGSMVTTTQEGQQVAMPIIFLLMIAFFLSFTVIRSPDSSFSFWVSMIPFFAPITMTIRIVTETPPFWQIALSLLIGVLTVIGLIWLTAKIYRTGMLMYGKRASIPEVLRWIRQA